MNNTDLQNLITKEIQAVAFEYLKELRSQKAVQGTDDYLNSKGMTEDEFDTIFFHGGKPKKDEKKTGPITIKEGTEPKLKITSNEIKEFEASLHDAIKNATVTFDKQSNGYSLSATRKANGEVEARASGKIIFGDNGEIVWVYSLLSGLNVNVINFKVDDKNKTTLEDLYNNFNDWQTKWRDSLNLPSAPEEGQAAAMPQQATGATPAASGPGIAPTPNAATAPTA